MLRSRMLLHSHSAMARVRCSRSCPVGVVVSNSRCERTTRWMPAPVTSLTRIPHLAQTSDAVNRQLSCFSCRYMNLLAVFQITCVPALEAPDG